MPPAAEAYAYPSVIVCSSVSPSTQCSLLQRTPSEAEPNVRKLARSRKVLSRSLIHDEAQVYAAGSEDMDTLTFNALILYRHLTFFEAKKEPISEINLQLALEGLEVEMSQFIDLCILLAYDFLEPIKGIRPKSSLKLVREYGGLKGVEHLRVKYTPLSSIALLAYDENSQAEKEEAAADRRRKDFGQPDVTL